MTGNCPGTGKKWMAGTGHPICPVCHRGVNSITGTRGKTMKQMRGKVVPAHTRR